MTFIEGLFDCCIHGELTLPQAEEWLEGDDLVIARRIIKSGLFLKRDKPIMCPNCGEDPAMDGGDLCEGCNAVLADQERRASGE